MKFIREHSLFVFILSLCLVLRLIPFFYYQFTYDELSGMERTQFDTFGELIQKGIRIDAHPAFVQALLWVLVNCFGYVTWIMKLPFLLCGFGAVVYAYFFGLRNFSKQVGSMVALVFAFSLIFIYYAPIARMYISGVFFSMALLYYFYEIFFLRNLKRSNYFFLGLFALLSALNQHINSLFALSLFVSALFFIDKNNYKLFVMTCLLVIVAYLPHLPVTLYQLGLAGIGREQGGWLESPDLLTIFGFIKVILGTGKVYVFVLLLIILSIILNRKAGINRSQLFLLIIFSLNYLIVYLYSIYRAPVFQYSVMLFASVAIIPFIFSFIDFKNKIVFQAAFFSLFILLIYKSYFKKDYFHQAVKTVFEYQFERTVYYKKLYGEKNVYPVFFDADAVMKKIYFNKYKTRFDCKISADSVLFTMRSFSHFVAGLKEDYLAVSSAMPAQQAVVHQYYPYLIENTQTQGINYKLYSKRKEDEKKIVADDKVLSYSDVFNKGRFSYGTTEKLPAGIKQFYLDVDSLKEFPFDAKAGINEVVNNEGQVILLIAGLKLKNTNKKQVEACISINDSGNNAPYAYSSKAASDFVMNADSSLYIYSDNFIGTNFPRMKDHSTITCYLWNRGRENFTLTNFEIRVIDYWPLKWHYWD